MFQDKRNATYPKGKDAASALRTMYTALLVKGHVWTNLIDIHDPVPYGHYLLDFMQVRLLKIIL